MPNKISFFFILTVFIFTNYTSAQTNNVVTVVGAMKNVMWKGQTYGTIDLDTISNRQHLYGLGPVEYLDGELLIIDGKSYKSTIRKAAIKVEETFKAKAPFFVYATVNKWEMQILPDTIKTIQQFESYLDNITKSLKRPFAFRLTGIPEMATIHIVNLPKGAKISSPDDAHRGQVNDSLTNEQGEIVGFFSTTHKSIFTHHDTFLHMHLITGDKTKMGHLDDIIFGKNRMSLYLPVD